ncbi:hypothetical protein LTR53_015470 [Teratosphaeriaceae sp. CCFEE 6253]|nr:hypothetical protein LTR53_015470 [Teratosphaeriaceae sp. CCFEE 6253]
MATPFSTLPIVDLSPLSTPNPTPDQLHALSRTLYDVFATTGFAYLVNTPISATHADVFQLARDFFRLEQADKRRLAKQTFVNSNPNTYRGYFPPQPGQADGNLKEGFEIGPADPPRRSLSTRRQQQQQRFDLAEPNVWPPEPTFPGGRAGLERLHGELQRLAAALLSLLATALGKPPEHFAAYLAYSLSTLRLLHYPPPPPPPAHPPPQTPDANGRSGPALCCTPHTDSGLLTLLHQDPTGGLEVRNARGEWIPAPYLPGSLVVNIGDLLARISGGRLVATVHRVVRSDTHTDTRAGGGGSMAGEGRGRPGPPGEEGRLSVPFFFEPGEACVVRDVDVDGKGEGEGVVYGDYVRAKMGTWVEYLDPVAERAVDAGVPRGPVAVEAC